MDLQLSGFSKCRLCASEISFNGVPIFTDNSLINDISSFINEHLPLKIEKDGIFQNIMCGSCNLQLHATISFFDKVRQGQDRLQTLLQQMENEMKCGLPPTEESTSQLSNDSLHLVFSNNLYPEIEIDNPTDSSDSLPTVSLEETLTATPKRPENPTDSSDSLPIVSLEETVIATPKRRGRPPKNKSVESSISFLTLPESNSVPDVQSISRVQRKRQLPLRYQGAVQDKELDRMINDVSSGGQDDVLNGDSFPFDESSKLTESEDQFLTLEPKINVKAFMELKRGRKYTPRKQKQVFVCDICGLGFLLKCYYSDHKALHEGTVIECKNCSDSFLKQESFDTHCLLNPQCAARINAPDGDENKTTNIVSDGIKKQDFICGSCNKVFLHEPSLALHVKAVHEDGRPYVCSVCDKSFNSVISLKTHLVHLHKKKNQKGYPCEICGKLFNHPSSVIYHRKAEHTVLQFDCDKCDRSFKHKQLLMRHQLVHSDVRPFVCKSCGASFKTKPNLMNHQSVHSGEKKHICELCGQQFAHKTSLNLHYRWHAGQKPFKCETCGKSFSQKGNLQEHQRIHTGEKPFACVYCERKFTTSSQYKLHVKRHVGERPWQCDICPKTFLHRDTYKCHIRRHRGEKPFACTYCDRDFSEQWALKKHLRLHTGEKPYSCEICSKTFADCSNLTKHKKVHEKLPRVKKDEKMDSSVWKFIKNHLENQGGDKPVGLSADREDDVEQIIYVTYDDPGNTTGVTSRVSNSDSILLPGSLDEDGLLDDGLSKSIQMTDELGNPVHFAMLDGGELQLTSGADGQALQVVTQDGHTIPVQITNIDEQSSEPSRLTLQLTSQIPTSLPSLETTPIKTPAKTKRSKNNLIQSTIVNSLHEPTSLSDSNLLLNQPLRGSSSKKMNMNFISAEGSKSLLSAATVDSSSALLSRDSQTPLLPSTSNSHKTSATSLLHNLNRSISSSGDFLSKQGNVSSFVQDAAESILLTHSDGSTSLLQNSALSDKVPNDGVLTIDEADSSQSIEFTVEGQKLRMMTSYNVVPMQIPVEFLNMN